MPERNNNLAKTPLRPRWVRDERGRYRPEGYEEAGIAIFAGPIYEVRLKRRTLAVYNSLQVAKTAAMRALERALGLTFTVDAKGRGRRRGTQTRNETPDQRLIRELGGPRQVSEMLGIPHGTVSAWVSRGSVSGHQLPKLVQAACERGIAVEKPKIAG